jgi:hypothetical protein
VHVCDGVFGILLVVEENVGGASVCPKAPINRQVKIFDVTKLPKYLVKVVLIDIFRKTLDDNLGALCQRTLLMVSA